MLIARLALLAVLALGAIATTALVVSAGAHAQNPSATPDDADGDGVANDPDLCEESESNEQVDAQGCGPLTMTGTFFGRSHPDMYSDPDVHGQCENARGDQCTFRLTLTLSKASARRLDVNRKIADVTMTTNKSTFSGRYVYNKVSAGISKKVAKAFRRAKDKKIPVTMTLTGTATRGPDQPVKLPKSTFTLKHTKPAGGFRYASVSVGPDGPETSGITP